MSSLQKFHRRTQPFKVNTLHTGTVSISGTAWVNQILTATNTIADVDGLGTFAYQWKRSGTAISSATSSTYTLVSADTGNTITVTITYTDGNGFIETETSAATALVVNNTLHTGTVSISGTAAVGSVLTATNNIADVDGLGTFTYQWKRSGSAISGATGTTYTLVAADDANTITVTITYTDGKGFTETETSAATASVITPIVYPTVARGSGNDTIGYCLGATTTQNGPRALNGPTIDSGALAGVQYQYNLYVAPLSTAAAKNWGSYNIARGTTHNWDGFANTNTLAAFGEAAHPAAYYAKSLTTGGYNTWYLPAINELVTMYYNKTTTPFATANQFAGGYIHCSTEIGAKPIYIANMTSPYFYSGTGGNGNGSKNGNYPVRAVRRSTV